jgi:hypothetical protein
MTTYALKDGVAQQDVGDVRLLMDSHAGRYLELNASGAMVLDLLLTHRTPAQITDALVQQFAVQREQAARDVAAITEALCAQGIILAQAITPCA